MLSVIRLKLARRRFSRLQQAARSATSRFVAERLEGRQLLSVAGNLDPSFGAEGSVAVAFPKEVSPTGDADFADRGVELSAVDTRNGKTVIAGIHFTGSFEAGTLFDSRELALARLDGSGALDPTFGSGGTLYSDVFREITDITVQADNGILVVGRLQSPETPVLARFKADGSLDTSFGDGDGIVEFSFAATGVREQGSKIYLAGSADLGGDQPAVFAAARLTADGTLDESFGVQGIATTQQRVDTTPVFMAVQADGKLVMASDAVRTLEPTVTSDATVVRLDTDGRADATFGNAGAENPGVSYVGLAQNDYAGGIDIGSDGSIYLGFGRVDATTTVVSRLTPTGQLDKVFDSLDRRMIVQGVRSTFDASGKVLVFGGVETSTNGGVEYINAIARYNSDGTIDTTFGAGGYIINAAGPFNSAQGGYLGDLQADGRIIAARGSISEQGAETSFIVVERRLSQGTSDEPTAPPPTSPPPTTPPPTTPPPPTEPPPTTPPVVGETPDAANPQGTLNVQVTPGLTGAIVEGQKARGKVTVALTNSTASPLIGRVNVELLLSSDNTLDNADTPLFAREKAMKFNPGQTKLVKLKVPQLPDDVSGDQVVVARVTAADSSQTVAASATKVTVVPATVDLVGIYNKTVTTTVTPGTSASLVLALQNLGTVSLSGDVGITITAVSEGSSSANVPLASSTIALNLKSKKTRSVPLRLTLPTDMQPGTYTLVAALDSNAAVAESNELNNTVISPTPLVVG